MEDYMPCQSCGLATHLTNDELAKAQQNLLFGFSTKDAAFWRLEHFHSGCRAEAKVVCVVFPQKNHVARSLRSHNNCENVLPRGTAYFTDSFSGV